MNSFIVSHGMKWIAGALR